VTARRSAGLLLYRSQRVLEVMLVHMGGPFWASRDTGAWSMPKGEPEPGEEPLAAALREFAEETGLAPPAGTPIDLGERRQSGGKLVHAWALEADTDVSAIDGNTFTLQWPPGSGQLREFPEVDRAGWFDLPSARSKLVKGQVSFLDALAAHLRAPRR
jgi:predicted NUDIX family NTP pyrophosphohydrolase